MPVFLDRHGIHGYTRKQLEDAIGLRPDEFGVAIHEIFYNEKEDVLYCICESPSKESIIKHHAKYGITCDSILQIDHLKTNEEISKEKLYVLGLLSARIAHDLRNPLSVIKNTMELMKLQNNDKQQKEHYDKINRTVSRMTHQINEVLDYVNPKPLQLESTTTTSIIQSSLEKIAKPNEVIINIQKNDLPLVCDKEKMETVLINLITNAIQVMNNKGKINIKTVDQKDKIVIEVEDNGPGISSDVLPKIFDPLFTTKPIGTGLGLTSCKNIIERHGGTIDVKTDLGAGTTFVMTLPKNPNIN